MTTSNRNRHDKASKFIQAAAEDIRAADLLYQGTLYRPAIYHLQQATEKTVKAYLLAQSTLDVRRLRTHNSVLLFADFLEWALDEYGPMLEFLKQVQALLPGTSPEQLSYLDPREARERISKLRAYAEQPTELRKHFPSYLDEGHKSSLQGFINIAEQLVSGGVKNKMESLYSAFGTLLKGISPGMLDEALDSSRALQEGALAMTALLPICSLFLLHNQDPRYPALLDPPDTNWELYTAGAPLVGALPRLMPLVKDVHSQVKQMIERSTKFTGQNHEEASDGR
jgi:hypothetical protein